jgi:hypothetical protein
MRRTILLCVLVLLALGVVSPTTAEPMANHVVGWGVTVAAWRDDGQGQATPPAELTDVVAIAAGWSHSLALRGDGSVVGWGHDDSGEATPPAGLTDVVAIATGNEYSLALRADGTVVGWGNDLAGQATPPAGLADVVAIAAGGHHGLALRGDGTVVAWGDNEDGQATPPAGLTDVSAIAAGYSFSLALRDDGTVVGWGDNGQGQATPPAELTDVSAIAAGYNHTLALHDDGSVVGWGNNADGRATPPPGLTGVFAIAAGTRHSLAIVPDVDSLDLAVSAGPAAGRIPVYSNGPATLTSGDYVIDPATGHVASIIGTGTIPSASDDATVAFNIAYSAVTKRWSGSVIVSDPGTGFSATIPIHAGRFEVWRNGTITRGTLWGIRGQSVPQKCFKVVFQIDDLG